MGQLTNLHFFFIFQVFSLRQCSLHYLIQTKVVVETKVEVNKVYFLNKDHKEVKFYKEAKFTLSKI